MKKKLSRATATPAKNTGRSIWVTLMPLARIAVSSLSAARWLKL